MMSDSEEESDPAVDDYRRFKKNPSVLSCIGSRRKKAVTEVMKMGQLTSIKAWERASSSV